MVVMRGTDIVQQNFTRAFERYTLGLCRHIQTSKALSALSVEMVVELFINKFKKINWLLGQKL
jgi:hypothetical protein